MGWNLVSPWFQDWYLDANPWKLQRFYIPLMSDLSNGHEGSKICRCSSDWGMRDFSYMNLETCVSTTSKFMKMIVDRSNTGLNIVDTLFLKPILCDLPGNRIKSHDSWRLAPKVVPFFWAMNSDLHWLGRLVIRILEQLMKTGTF